MAKFYGIAGTRRGSVGNETYYMHKTQNIVKKKAVYVTDPRTRKQIMQRMKMKNTLLGLKNVKNALDLDTFTNEEVIENHENAYVKNNVRNCFVIDRFTSNIPNFPTLSNNVVCSYGTLNSLQLTSNLNENTMGIVVKGQYNENKTIGQLTNDLMNSFEFLRNNDAITMFYYYCSNITSSAERLFDWAYVGAPNNSVEIITGRKTIVLKTNDDRLISTVGFTTQESAIDVDNYILFPNVKNDEDNLIANINCNYPCYFSCFYSRTIAEDQFNFCIATTCYNKGYRDMITFAQKPEYVEFSLLSWNVAPENEENNNEHE